MRQGGEPGSVVLDARSRSTSAPFGSRAVQEIIQYKIIPRCSAQNNIWICPRINPRNLANMPSLARPLGRGPRAPACAARCGQAEAPAAAPHKAKQRVKQFYGIRLFGSPFGGR